MVNLKPLVSQGARQLSSKATVQNSKHTKAIAILVGATSVATCGVLVAREVLSIKEKINLTDHLMNTIDHIEHNARSYIYLEKPDTKNLRDEDSARRIVDGQTSESTMHMADISRQLLALARQKPKMLSWVRAYSHDPWKLLSLAQNDDHTVRLLGVKALASHHGWSDWQYVQLAQACDMRTQIGLARSENADLRLFLRPPKLSGEKDSIADKLYTVLTLLPSADADPCVQFFTEFASRAVKKATSEDQAKLSLGSQEPSFADALSKGADDSVELICLQALATHSTIPSHCVEMSRVGVIPLLLNIYQEREHNYGILIVIARIIGNFALNEELHKPLYQAGWVTILAHWIRSPNLKLSIQASRALANIDRDFGGKKYEKGIYLVYPEYRTDHMLCADVVFVHGLLGGPFKTWRQGKREPVAASGPVSAEPLVADDDGAEDMKNDAGYTECWPKDWLPQDFPNVRVLMVGYDTYLSAWGEKCPHGTAKRSLDQRATKMLQKLKAAGVGERPIIFVTHSMGGLLVKQMLFHAMRDPNMEGLFTNTRSVVFYSTPHRGSSLASKTEQAKYLLYPSVEVKELVSDSPKLLKLHDEFINIAKIHNISVLSIGEMSKTPIGPRGAIETHIVPPTSADPGIGDFHLVTDNHLYVCKPRAPSSPAYHLLVEHLGRIVPRDLELHIAQASSEDHLFLDMFHMS